MSEPVAPSGYKYAHTIDGKPAFSKYTSPIANPATGAHLADAPVASPEQLDQAVDAAGKAFLTWSSRTYEERAEVLLEIAEIIEAGADVYKRLLTTEQGKPVRLLSCRSSFQRYFAHKRCSIKRLSSR